MAELGVYQGDFARVLNKALPERKLYLFDTFEGFNKQELQNEVDKYGKSVESMLFYDKIVSSNVNLEAVVNSMPNPSTIVIKKGWFPDTFDIPDERFCFVNIDPDLYEPTKAGLELFYPRMSKGGVILVHDYTKLIGVTEAVDEFLAKTPDAISLPIGDFLSIAIIKTK
jgi:hypothetical protein